MPFIKQSFVLAVMAGWVGSLHAAVSVAWQQVFVPANAHLVGNSTINGKLPHSFFSTFELKVTLTEGDGFTGGAFRWYDPGYPLYRHTLPDPEEILPAVNSDFTRLFGPSSTNPTSGLSTGVAFPHNIFGTRINGALRADGTIGPATEAAIPDGTDGTNSPSDDLLAVVWDHPTSQLNLAGTYTVLRVTAPSSAYLPHTKWVPGGVVGQGSIVQFRLASGELYSLQIPQVFIGPEPSMTVVSAALLAGALSFRTRRRDVGILPR